jgi:hypothetical protein
MPNHVKPSNARGNRLDIFDPFSGMWLWVRAEHCTHPTQDWCDCDWCRLRESFCQDGR